MDKEHCIVIWKLLLGLIIVLVVGYVGGHFGPPDKSGTPVPDAIGGYVCEAAGSSGICATEADGSIKAVTAAPGRFS